MNPFGMGYVLGFGVLLRSDATVGKASTVRQRNATGCWFDVLNRQIAGITARCLNEVFTGE